MQRFTQLFDELDSSTRTLDKLAALERYFREAPPADAAWALYLLCGQKIKRTLTTKQLRVWATQVTGLPDWLVDESYAHVGDLAETLSALLPAVDGDCPLALSQFIAAHVQGLKGLPEAELRQRVIANWRTLNRQERFLWHKMLTGGFRVGVSRTMVAKALANVAQVDPAVMAHRLTGNWQPTAEFFSGLLTATSSTRDAGQPYPFFLAHPLEGTVSSLGTVKEWQIEWKWDGIRVQVIRRGGQLLLWSRGEELLTDRFPELHGLTSALPEGTVLDGELLAWRGDEPLPFGLLQKRVNRIRVDAKLLAQAPVALMAYDLLESAGDDVREQPLSLRRNWLEELFHHRQAELATLPVRLSPLVAANDWQQVIAARAEARERGVEGLMLKRQDSPYGAGRIRGPWWKWKVSPLSIDAVLMYAQAGHGRRAGLFTDYTFGVWHQEQLVPVAKAYSGLTDAELTEVNTFIRTHATDKFGPVRVVEPLLVFELHFEGIQASPRHKSGLAVRFPRIARWRKDKQPDEADSLETLRGMLAGMTNV